MRKSRRRPWQPGLMRKRTLKTVSEMQVHKREEQKGRGKISKTSNELSKDQTLVSIMARKGEGLATLGVLASCGADG